MLESLRKSDEIAFRLLQWHIRHGVFSFSSLSGTGFFELALHTVGKVATFKDYPYNKWRGIRSCTACDSARHCRQSLASFVTPTVASHIFCDILDRLPELVRKAVDAITWPEKNTIKDQPPQQTIETIRDMMHQMMHILEDVDYGRAMSMCDIHNKPCRTQPLSQDPSVDFCVGFFISP